MALDGDAAVAGDAGERRPGALAKAAQQRARPSVDEALHETLMQRVREPILERARPFLPGRGIGEPVAAIGDIGERPHARQTRRQGVDIAVGAIEGGKLALHPILGQAPVALGQMLEQGRDEARVLVLSRLAEVRRLAHFPEANEVGAISAAALNRLVGRELAERRLVLGFVGEFQAPDRRGLGERAQQAGQRLKVEFGVSPFRRRDGWKDMAFDRGDEILVHVRAVARHAEGSVLAEPAGPTGDLADFLAVKPARAPAVELAQAGEGDMVDVHVEAHADRVGGDEEIDFARLKEIDLRVSGSGRQRTHHHRRAAALAANEFGDGVDGVGREGDDRAAPRQARQLLRPVVDQLREAVARLDLGAGQRRRMRGAMVAAPSSMVSERPRA